ncbi:response regulator transcription factor [Paenibacillus spongiae]|uniref:Response regulator n=1 Tax=Paenibacillus spongiae TaxID=2909671 RepID=A0ABY5S1P4_9BACL|nr:response regulator [Paenibacillus spongiae]UVI27368.1 response regulator [Paenibacillus spongiae]
MLKVLLVDDEPGALKSMKYLVDWEQYGFQIAGEARSGKQALDLLERNDYSLLVTDIRMPGIDGLELICKLREFSQIPVIVMSGYEEFGYVKECMKRGVKDYLLKPVGEEDLSRLLTTVKSEFASQQLLDMQLYLGIPAMRDQLLKKWVRGVVKEEEAAEQFELLKIKVMTGDSYCCLFVEMEFLETGDSFWTDAEIQIKRFAVRNVMEDVIAGSGYMFEESFERYGVLLHPQGSGEDDDSSEEAMRICERIRDCVAKYAKVAVTIGLGEVVCSPREIVRSCYTADQMLDRKFLVGSEAIITPNGLEATDGWSALEEIQHVQYVVEAVKELDRERVSRQLAGRMHDYAKQHTPKSIVKSMVLELVVNLFRLVRELGIPYESIFNLNLNDYGTIMEAKKMEKLFEFAENKCMQTIEQLERSMPPQPANTVQLVKRIVESEYGTNISLRSIASQVYMNAAYLGQLFKAEEGISFNDHLLRVRMERAKELLLATELKAYEVAQAVGYRELDWFYKRFKEYTGMSTSEFRNR